MTIHCHECPVARGPARCSRERGREAHGGRAVLLATALVATFGVDAAPTPGPEAEDDAWRSRLYDLTIETGMPHLDENLRYATTRARRCLGRADLAQAFPVLHHVALQDCALAAAGIDARDASFELRCDGGHGTTGRASWHLEPAGIAGTLEVKLGAKNMTFHQRVSGRALGLCPAASEGGP